MSVTVGTHNLHDESGTPTLFADLIVFTEAWPARIARTVRDTRWRMVVCRQQPDLVVVYDRTLFRRLPTVTRYAKYVDGIPHVTPNRGTFTVPLVHRDTGRRLRVNAEHRINAAFPPHIRGEAKFREDSWRIHTAGTLRAMKRQDRAGLLTLSMGDVNTPHGVRGYPGWNEVGEHFDRIGSNAPLRELQVLGKAGSDHPRIRATLILR